MLYPASELLFSAGAVIFDKTRTSVLAIVSKNDQRGVEEIMFPKGRLEKDETPAAAAVREVLEETGARCTLWPGLQAMETRHSKAISKTKVVYWYAGDLVAMGEQMLESHEKLEVRWVDVESAASVLSFENDRELLAICLEALADGLIGKQAT